MITLDPATHIYRNEHLDIIPGVTSILEPLYNFDGIPRHILDAAAQFGKHVHLACQLFDLGTLDEENLDPKLWPYLTGWRMFLEDTGFVIHENERLVYSPRYNYAGTLDRAGELNGKKTIVDIKSTAIPSPVTGPQTAAYCQAYLEETGVRYAYRYTVQLSPNKYNLVSHRGKADFAVFLACLSIRNWRKINYS